MILALEGGGPGSPEDAFAQDCGPLCPGLRTPLLRICGPYWLGAEGSMVRICMRSCIGGKIAAFGDGSETGNRKTDTQFEETLKMYYKLVIDII